MLLTNHLIPRRRRHASRMTASMLSSSCKDSRELDAVRRENPRTQASADPLHIAASKSRNQDEVHLGQAFKKSYRNDPSATTTFPSSTTIVTRHYRHEIERLREENEYIRAQRDALRQQQAEAPSPYPYNDNNYMP
ncbi:hypothetical protein Hypma_005779 [Hypsizygus marmoreus]|uniref:Uncharacterized protein n=1 Tax=Hypsizygus marmoreus TaxID=39966 RepID=A0A369KIN8_HYPMA|nr:hypothetical protein Hypma_005779 [Hypsizygus marmoreus]